MKLMHNTSSRLEEYFAAKDAQVCGEMDTIRVFRFSSLQLSSLESYCIFQNQHQLIRIRTHEQE